LRALRTLEPCDPRIVVIGASADQVAALLPSDVAVVVNPDHLTGMASSLSSGLRAVPDDADAVLVTLVDLPDLTAAVTERVLAAAGPQPRRALARAVFHGSPGHPVLIGADHLPAVLQSLASGGPDSGAGRYLGVHGAAEIECGDLAGGRDQDAPPTDMPRG
jgi:CTP:molybdopterin cytidylyltransferase MocA